MSFLTEQYPIIVCDPANLAQLKTLMHGELSVHNEDKHKITMTNGSYKSILGEKNDFEINQ